MNHNPGLFPTEARLPLSPFGGEKTLVSGAKINDFEFQTLPNLRKRKVFISENARETSGETYVETGETYVEPLRKPKEPQGKHM